MFEHRCLGIGCLKKTKRLAASLDFCANILPVIRQDKRNPKLTDGPTISSCGLLEGPGDPASAIVRHIPGSKTSTQGDHASLLHLASDKHFQGR